MTEAAPEGFAVKGTSTLYRKGEHGKEEVLQWVKTNRLEEEKWHLLFEGIEDIFSADMKVPEIPKPITDHEDLLTVYPMGDPHLGMYSWAEETGTDFDLKIAEHNLTEAMARLVESAPASDHALICNVGDFFHSDTTENRTRRAGHALDVDTRWPKVLRVGIFAMRQCIEHALRKHAKVHVINEIGNHDDQTAQVLAIALDLAYENNPRVTIDTSPAYFHYYRFHDVLIGVTHGDKVKPEGLLGVMATDRADDWGETTRRYWYTGHIHTRKVYDLPGCEVESFRTLAPKDLWTSQHGYRTLREMLCIVHHKNYGEIERHRKDILMVE